MLDFVKIIENPKNNGRVIELLPVFNAKRRSKDIMTKGGDFYAIWDEEQGLWLTEFNDALMLIDKEIDSYMESKHYNSMPYANIVPKYVGYLSSNNKQVDVFKQFCKDYKFQPTILDCNLIFPCEKPNKENYNSKVLPYDMKRGDISCYEELISTLYDKHERRKFEWAIGSILSNESKDIQKFYVFYGKAGTGKSTVLNIIDMIFSGYTAPFKSSDLGNASKDFALEAFSTNPLVSIEHDGDLSKIDDNTRLNSIVSHENMLTNEKFKKQYSMRFISTLFIGTNKPVKITDGRSGLLRRLIDIYPTEEKVPKSRYNYLWENIKNEIPSIAWHCWNLYNRLGKDYYDGYLPQKMNDITDHFYDFILENQESYKNGVTLAKAFNDYKEYCDFSGVSYPYNKSRFKQEMFVYFEKLEVDHYDGNSHSRNFFINFRIPESKDGEEKSEPENKEKEEKEESWLKFDCTSSLFDDIFSNCPAQYANSSETPSYKWDNVKTKLKDISTKRLHYVKIPEKYVHIDFDLKDENGNKSFKKNLEAASKWPKTYAELSKSGEGIHLCYIYDGDTSTLERIYDKDIEIKVFNGNGSLRRKLTKCNDIPIATIGDMLPTRKKGATMYNAESLKNERHLRILILKNLHKEIHPNTRPSIDFIFQLLEDAYNGGMHYDVTDMRPAILSFAKESTHQAEYCVKRVSEMKFSSEEASDDTELTETKDIPIVFYDVEVFPNLFILNYKFKGKENKVQRMINPSGKEVGSLFKYRLVGFNNRRYDNHIIYARAMGYNNEELFRLSKRIIDKSANCFFGEAYNLSYTDIYDYSSVKQSLKKWEIQLGIHHQELGLPWDQPVPENLWEKVALYCDNDVIATEAVWDATQADFIAREILAEIAHGTVNETTNSLTTKIIFGNEKNPQTKFVYRDLSKPVTDISDDMKEFLTECFPEMMSELHNGDSLLPYFPGYSFDAGNSTYKEFNGEKSSSNPNGKYVGEGGLVWSAPGMYSWVWTFDVMSEHPHSAMAEYLFGIFTRRFHELVELRAAIKHKDISKARTLLNGVLAKYLDDTSMLKTLAYALKIAINSVYGLTAAKFANAFKDPRNKDNIVAKRGALFMIDLKNALENMGAVPIHIKTDSIKVVNPTKEICDFIFAFGKKYGYTFEVEHIFEKICLVNDAVYIGLLSRDDEDWISKCEDAKQKAKENGTEYIEPTRWTATGTQFAVPYVFKTLFSHEPLVFNDKCETKEVQSSLYLDFTDGMDNVEEAEIAKHYRYGDRVAKTNKDKTICEKFSGYSIEDLEKEIEKGHNLRFVGKIGQFCPVLSNGGNLVREAVNNSTGEKTFVNATGTKGYLWLESEVVKEMNKENDIDESYYKKLVNEAIDEINKYGDFEWFTEQAS